MGDNKIKTAHEMLSEHKEMLEKTTTRYEKKKIWHRYSFLLLFVLFITLTLVSNQQSEKELQKKYDNLLSAYNTNNFELMQASFNDLDLLLRSDALTFYEDAFYGNKINNTLALGAYAEKGEIVVESAEDLSFQSIKGNDQKQVVNQSGSYINIYENIVCYRSNLNRQPCYTVIGDNSIYPLLEEQVGEMMICEDYLYYVSFSDDANLYRLDLKNIEGSIPELVVDENIKSFIVIGDSVIFNTYGHDLKRCTIGETSITIASGIKTFFYLNGLLVENNKDIILLDSVSNKGKMLIEDAGNLLYAEENFIYYSRGKELYRFNIKLQETILLTDIYDAYRSICRTAAGYLVIGIVADSDGNYFEKSSLLAM